MSNEEKYTWVQEIKHEDVLKYKELSSDRNPIHTDFKFAKAKGFPNQVVYGQLTLAAVSAAIGNVFPGPGSVILNQQFDFLAPVYVGDRLTVNLTIKHKNIDLKTFVLNVSILKLNQEVVARGFVTVSKPEDISENIISDNFIAAEKRPIIITGAVSHIGSEIARLLSRNNFPLIVNYNSNESKALALVDELKSINPHVECVQADLEDERQSNYLFRRAISLFGSVFGLVNNAFTSPRNIYVEDLTPNDFIDSFSRDFKITSNITLEAAKYMKNRQAGSIVTIGSTSSGKDLNTKWLPYSLSKNAISVFTKYLSDTYGPFGVAANVIEPGPTGQGMSSGMSNMQKAKILKSSVTGRLNTPSDISNIALFLLSQQRNSVTGQTFHCDGI